MGLVNQAEEADRKTASIKVSVDNLPNQNADEAMKYSIKQGAIGGAYGFLGSTLFSLLAYKICKDFSRI
jgi:hypothetical protein